jgi:hypothetical protein
MFKRVLFESSTIALSQAYQERANTMTDEGMGFQRMNHTVDTRLALVGRKFTQHLAHTVSVACE